MDFPDRVGTLLDMPSGEKEVVLRELRSHYDEIRLQLESEGFSEEQATAKATAMLGDPWEVALTLNREHCVSSWKTAFLTALPFLALAANEYAIRIAGLARLRGPDSDGITYPLLSSITATYLVLTIPLAAILLGMSIRELVCGRRPLWLSTWLAAGFVLGADAVGAILAKVLSFEAITHHIIPVIASLFVICLATTLAACWHVSHWRRRLVIASAIGIGCLLAILPAWPPSHHAHAIQLAIGVCSFLIMGILVAVSGFAFAVAVFQYHRFGDPLRASLFLFTSSWASGAPHLFEAGDWWPISQAWQQSQGVVFGLCLAFLVVLAFARASTPDKKRRIVGWFAAICGAVTADVLGTWLATMLAFWIPQGIHDRHLSEERNRPAAPDSPSGITA